MLQDEPAQNTSVVNSDAETNASTVTSANATSVGAGTLTMGTVVVPGRYRSGTVDVRRQLDQTNAMAVWWDMWVKNNLTETGHLALQDSPSQK